MSIKNRAGHSLKNLSDMQRFKFYALKTGYGCWQWSGTVLSNGYGQATINGSITSAHRASWILHNGEIENGLCVLHKCDNPSCVNPEHLFLGTNLDNMQDKVNKGRHDPSRGEKNGQNKLTEHQARLINASPLVYGNSIKLSKMFNVSTSLISRIKSKRSWKYLPEPTEEEKQEVIELLNK